MFLVILVPTKATSCYIKELSLDESFCNYGQSPSLIVLVPLAQGSVLQVLVQSVELDAVGRVKLWAHLI